MPNFQHCFEHFEALSSVELEMESLSILAELDYDNRTEEHRILYFEAKKETQSRIYFKNGNRGRIAAMQQQSKDALLHSVQETRVDRDEFKDILQTSG